MDTSVGDGMVKFSAQERCLDEHLESMLPALNLYGKKMKKFQLRRKMTEDKIWQPKRKKITNQT